MTGNKKLLNLEEAAAHLECDEKFLRQAATSGELPYSNQGERMMFEIHHLEDWFSNLLLHAPSKNSKGELTIDLLEISPVENMEPYIEGKTKAAILKNLTAICNRTGLLYNSEEFLEEIKKREECASTAMANGAAIVHPENRDEYLCEAPFCVIAKSRQPVFFGEADGIPTDIFFVVGAPDNTSHLKILAGLCHLLGNTSLLNDLRQAEDAEAMRQALEDAVRKMAK